MTNRVAITGMGLIDNLGNSPEICFESYIEETVLLAEQSQFFAKKDNLLVPDIIRKPLYASLTDINKMSFHVVEQCLIDNDYTDDVFTIFSTLSAGNPDNLDYADNILKEKNTFRPKKLIQGLKDFANGCIPMVYNFTGGATGLNSACATGLYQLDYAFRLTDDYDYVLCGASEYGNNNWDIHFFQQLGALGSQSRPFCKTRDGFIMGEGSSCLLLENENKAKSRGANILGYLHKPALATDGSAGNAVAPSDVGIKKCMNKVIEKIDSNDISFVNAHATSTPAGDDVEYFAIESLLPETPVVSFKSKIGHTLGASSITEVVYSLMSLNNKVVPKNHNIIDCDLNNVCRKTYPSEKKFVLKNSLGFGGKCGSVIIESS